MKRTRKTLIWGTALMLASVAPAAAQSFGLGGYGARVGWVVPEELDGTWTLGAHAELEQPGSRLRVQPSFMFWSEDGIRDLNPNLDVSYHFHPEGFATPYVGAGMGLHWVGNDEDSDTDFGANAFGGIRLPLASSSYFLEGRFSVTDVSQFGILGGITLSAR